MESAKGSPVPLSQEEVDALARGVMPEEQIARILETYSVEVASESREARRRKLEPADLTMEELTILAEGAETPDETSSKLAASAKRDKNRKRAISARASAPRLRPPASRSTRKIEE